MNAVELIQRKRDRMELTSEEIAWLIESYTGGKVADYQMAAMAMAVFLNGLNRLRAGGLDRGDAQLGRGSQLSRGRRCPRSTSTRPVELGTRSRFPSPRWWRPVGWRSR